MHAYRTRRLSHFICFVVTHTHITYARRRCRWLTKLINCDQNDKCVEREKIAIPEKPNNYIMLHNDCQRFPIMDAIRATIEMTRAVSENRTSDQSRCDCFLAKM